MLADLKVFQHVAYKVALSLSLKEMQQEEWWKELLQPSAILLGESDSKEVRRSHGPQGSCVGVRDSGKGFDNC